MNMKRRILALLLCAALCLGLYIPASAATVSADEAAETLRMLGLFNGGGAGLELERAATRSEAVVMLLRLLGLEQTALTVNGSSAFSDAGWADVYLAYAAGMGLVRGRSATVFAGDEPVSARDFLTMALRALGYADGVDFTWETSVAFADAVGLTRGEYAAARDFLREDMALISYTALTLRPKGADARLIERLYRAGAVTEAALLRTRLASAVNADKTAHTPAEIYELSSSAVFLVEMYETEEDLEAGRRAARGSGFFLSADGAAALCWHELEDFSYVRVTTTDGRRYDLTDVLYYDVDYDVAVVRVSRTDTEGRLTRSFPYLDLGDSAAVVQGDAVYTVSNPLGYAADSFSNGVLANRARLVYVEDYPYLQYTAPTSQGSSGCPVINIYGEAVGVHMGYFSGGDNLYLAVPVNAIRGVDLSAAGTPLPDVRAIEREKRENAVLTADAAEVTVEVGETASVLISTDCPGLLDVSVIASNRGIVSLDWGDFVTLQSCPLEITGRTPGETDVRVVFRSGDANPEAEAVIHVTVTGGEDPEETESEAEPEWEPETVPEEWSV